LNSRKNSELPCVSETIDYRGRWERAMFERKLQANAAVDWQQAHYIGAFYYNLVYTFIETIHGSSIDSENAMNRGYRQPLIGQRNTIVRQEHQQLYNRKLGNWNTKIVENTDALGPVYAGVKDARNSKCQLEKIDYRSVSYVF
jgi:hypothetical protein